MLRFAPDELGRRVANCSWLSEDMAMGHLASSVCGLILCLAADINAQIAAPCFHTALGTNLNLGDDSVAMNLQLGFSFPGPAGAVTSISVSSNGFLWLEPANAAPGCCAGNSAAFLAEPPRVAVLWTDLVPVAGVWFRAASPAFPGRAVITWRVRPFTGTHELTLQAVLLPNGEIEMTYGAPGAIAPLPGETLVGVSAGHGSPGQALSLSGLAPENTISTAAATGYEVFAPSTWNLLGRRIVWRRATTSGFLVTRTTNCSVTSGTMSLFGGGCPQPATIYEVFAPGTLDLANRSIRCEPLAHGAYRVVAGGAMRQGLGSRLPTTNGLASAVSLPFAFPHGGTTTSIVDVSENGCVHLETGSIPHSRCCEGNVQLFLADPPSIAVLWQEMTAIGPFSGVWVEHDPAGPATYLTWVQMAEAGLPQSLNTAQLALFADGAFELRYGHVANTAHRCLVGYAPGRANFDPGHRDLTATPFHTDPGGRPLRIGVTNADAGRGRTVVQAIVDLPANATLVALALGLRAWPIGIDLRPLGMDGCMRWIDVDAVHALVGATPPSTPVPLAIPPSNELLGVRIHEQAFVFAPGSNPLGVIASNAALIVIG